MTNNFHDLITRMANELDEYRRLLLDDCTVTHRLSNEARAVLGEADEPAVPQGREPAAVAEQPSDQELIQPAIEIGLAFQPHPKVAQVYVQYDVAEEPLNPRLIAYARAVLARWGNPAPPPADGEVAELAAWLRETGDTIQPSHLAEHQRYKRAAELLQRQALVPVSVSERPWEREGWCDVEGRFWAEHISRSGVASWRCAAASDLGGWAVRCLPAHALPLPEVGE